MKGGRIGSMVGDKSSQAKVKSSRFGEDLRNKCESVSCVSYVTG